MNKPPINWADWNKTLPVARRIEAVIYPAPQSHREFCDRINRIGTINAILQDVGELRGGLEIEWQPKEMANGSQ